MRSPRRLRPVLHIGLDGVPPETLFRWFWRDLPTIRRLCAHGLYGPLRTCEPPITVPAWMVMATGRSPDHLNLYGFRQRPAGSYQEAELVDSRAWRTPAVWDYVQRAGRRVGLFAVPPGYPPRPVNGWWVGCHLTPSSAARWATPAPVQRELERVIGGRYQSDVTFRTHARREVRRDLIRMTDQHDRMLSHLLRRHPCDYTMLVEIGTDRLHHAFWRAIDPSTPPARRRVTEQAWARAYYRRIDAAIARWIAAMPEDPIVVVTSDHGAKAMHGAFCINDWLRQEGYLTVTRPMPPGTPLERMPIDWTRTAAWGWGGYYARVFINLKGREPEGSVPPSRYPALCRELERKLAGIRTPDGRRLSVVVRRPPARNLRTGAPDLMVYLGDLHWRAAQTMGYATPFLTENDTGADDAVHSWQGVLIIADPRRRLGRRVQGARLIDVAPTLLELMGLPVPRTLEGRSLARQMR